MLTRRLLPLLSNRILTSSLCPFSAFSLVEFTIGLFSNALSSVFWTFKSTWKTTSSPDDERRIDADSSQSLQSATSAPALCPSAQEILSSTHPSPSPTLDPRLANKVIAATRINYTYTHCDPTLLTMINLATNIDTAPATTNTPE